MESGYYPQPTPVIPNLPAWYVATPPSAMAKVPVLSHPTQHVRVIGQLAAGTTVEAIRHEGAWLYVRLPDASFGYIAAASAMPAMQAGYVAGAQAPAHGGLMSAPAQTGQPGAQGYTRGLRQGTGRAVLSGILMVAGAVGLVFGGIIGSVFIAQCPFGTTNPYSSSCTLVGYPFVSLGITHIVVGLICLVIGIMMRVSARKG